MWSGRQSRAFLPRRSSTDGRSSPFITKGTLQYPTAASHNGGNGDHSDAYGRHIYITKAHQSQHGRRYTDSRVGARWIETQNVRGFTPGSRSKWLEAWRRTPVKERPLAWIAQQTHISSHGEAANLTAKWASLWGRTESHQGAGLSYWSVYTSSTGGVAILLNPSVAEATSPWQQNMWTSRANAVDIGDYRLVNVYAPNCSADRERFFTGLQQWPWQQHDSVIAGDFNCVQSPPLDRLGGTRSGRPESAALHTLLHSLSLEDALTLCAGVTDDDEVLAPTDFFTYWGPNTASRIDRFYVPQSWAAVVQWVSVDEPNVQSDHQRVRLHLHDTRHTQHQTITAGTASCDLPYQDCAACKNHR